MKTTQQQLVNFAKERSFELCLYHRSDDTMFVQSPEAILEAAAEELRQQFPDVEIMFLRPGTRLFRLPSKQEAVGE